MATADDTKTAQNTAETAANTVVDDGAQLGVRRYFTIPGRDPFDEVEWETRDAFIPGKDKPAFEQKGVEFPKFWSQTATNIVAQKYFRGRMGSPERERSVKQMIGRVVDTVGTLGPRGRLLRERRGGADLRGRAEGDPRQPARGLQLAGLVQRRVRGEAAVLGMPAVPRARLDARGNGADRRARRRRPGRARGLRRATASRGSSPSSATAGSRSSASRCETAAGSRRPPTTS